MHCGAKGHWNGDPKRHCGSLIVEADSQSEAAVLARLYQFLSAPNGRERLERLADYLPVIEESERDAAEIPF